jgi:hypothetical protein
MRNKENCVESYLDRLALLPIVKREIYGYDLNNKPNDWCVWTDIGYSVELWCWQENDEHLRKRLKELRNV